MTPFAISRDASGDGYTLSPDTALTRALLDTVRSAPSRDALTRCIADRRGYTNNDGGFGVVFANDLDAYDRAVAPLRDGTVQVYGYFGPPAGYEYELEEADFLEFVAEFLRVQR